MFPAQMMAQNNVVLDYIQHQSDIKEGGSGLFKFKEDTFLVTVASTAVGTKNEASCKAIGIGKAKRDMMAYVNGSEITSYTELITSEDIIEACNSKSVIAEQKFVEYIREKVIGTIKEVKTLGGWYSDDMSMYYFAIYKLVQ